jgi:hypothetical protein
MAQPGLFAAASSGCLFAAASSRPCLCRLHGPALDPRRRRSPLPRMPVPFVAARSTCPAHASVVRPAHANIAKHSMSRLTLQLMSRLMSQLMYGHFTPQGLNRRRTFTRAVPARLSPKHRKGHSRTFTLGFPGRRLGAALPRSSGSRLRRRCSPARSARASESCEWRWPRAVQCPHLRLD